MKYSVSLFLIFMSAFSIQIVAQGGLLITPKRVVFEGNNQKTEFNLMNTSPDTATYSISFRNYNMTEEGKLVLIERPDSADMIAEPFLRYFPRQVTLAPGESQVVALQFRRAPGMAAGEYRSHLWFRDERNYKPLTKENTQVDTTNLSVSVIAIYGITIPVIIRTGDVSVGATLTDLSLESQHDSIPVLNLTVKRTGNISISGKLTVEYIPEVGKPSQAGLVNVVIYTNIHKRNITIKLDRTPGLNLSGGKLRLRYTSQDGEKFVLYAEGELELKE